MYKLIRPILFLWSPEKAHYLAMNTFSLMAKIPGIHWILKVCFKPRHQSMVRFCGLEFKNPFGLAAGFDKNAKWLDAIQLLGFSHVEIGTVTPLPQAGNEQPRLFRLPADAALINRMGFNNEGADAVVARLKNRPAGLIVGGNIGKNKITPNEKAMDDYVICFEKLYDYVDYLVVNVSSPNTPGLRDLQDKDFLKELFSKLHALRQSKAKWKPVLLKIAPDMAKEGFAEIANVVLLAGIDGLIISNTTISRDQLETSKLRIDEIGAGGLSGKPVKELSDLALQTMASQLPADYPFIGVGGIFTNSDANTKFKAGAKLVQIYTGFIYEGPGIVRKLSKKNL